MTEFDNIIDYMETEQPNYAEERIKPLRTKPIPCKKCKKGLHPTEFKTDNFIDNVCGNCTDKE